MGTKLPRLIMLTICCYSIFIAISGTPPAMADYYKYKDKKGTICFTNDLNTIPEQYRKNALLVAKDTPPPPEITLPATSTATTEAIPDEPKGFMAEHPRLKIASILTAVVIGVSVIFMLIGRIASALNCSQLGNVIRLALILGLIAYGYISYAHKMQAVLESFKGKTDDIQKVHENNARKMEEQLK